MQVGPYIFNANGDIIAGKHPITVGEINAYMLGRHYDGFEKQFSCEQLDLFISTIKKGCADSGQCNEYTQANFARLLDLQTKLKC